MTNTAVIKQPMAISTAQPHNLLHCATELLAVALGDNGTDGFATHCEALYAMLPVVRHDDLSRAICRAATIHGVAPLVYQQLDQAGCLDAIPETVRQFLLQQHERNQQKMEVMLEELRAVLVAAAEHGIDLLPLKGATLTMSYYSSPALRPMADLDLLAHPSDELAALDLLQTLGYLERDHTERHRVLALPRNSGPVVDTTGEHRDNPRSLELHTALKEHFWGIGYELTTSAWVNSDMTRWCGIPVRQMRPLPLLEHLLIHATTDIMAGKLRLIRLNDLALVGARLHDAQWSELVASAQRRGEARMLYAPLLLQQRYLGGVPAEALSALEAAVPSPLRRYLARSDAYSVSLCNTTPSSLADKLCWYRPGPEKVHALQAMIVPTHADLRARFPRLARPPLMPLAYGGYALLAASWPLRRLLRLRRQAARS